SIYQLSTINYKLVFGVPQCGVAPGQSAVFYKGEQMLGGGVIQA
ncbi:MAG: aminomethyltransferase beta-barrel domain-containing protein, partial [Patescibacteria group bacterium]